MLRSALRRLFILFAVIIGLTSATALAIGALAHASLLRALADGFYVAGVAVLIGSFVLGLRGPVRAEWGEGQEETVRRGGMLMPRVIRRTTVDERTEARQNSLAFFALGLALILIGAGFDPSRRAF